MITKRIIARSATRKEYLANITAVKARTAHRTSLSCGSLVHGFAALLNKSA